jgi:hypothetical protein
MCDGDLFRYNWTAVDAPIDLRINSDVKVLVRASGLAINLVFIVSEEQLDIGPIELSRIETIEVGRELALNCSSNRIPIAFEPDDALAFGNWLVRFCGQHLAHANPNPPLKSHHH